MEGYITHIKMAVVTFAGTSAFSIALLKSSFTLCARTGRVQLSVSVAYFRVMLLPISNRFNQGAVDGFVRHLVRDGIF